VHTKDPPQSLLMMHVAPTSIFLASLQLAASHADTTINPRTRWHDADMSILRVCFQRIEEPTGRRYHSGRVMG
jgi:hypothetical protein